jgi:hypothetical protein
MRWRSLLGGARARPVAAPDWGVWVAAVQGTMTTLDDGQRYVSCRGCLSLGIVVSRRRSSCCRVRRFGSGGGSVVCIAGLASAGKAAWTIVRVHDRLSDASADCLRLFAAVEGKSRRQFPRSASCLSPSSIPPSPFPLPLPLRAPHSHLTNALTSPPTGRRPHGLHAPPLPLAARRGRLCETGCEDGEGGGGGSLYSVRCVLRYYYYVAEDVRRTRPLRVGVSRRNLRVRSASTTSPSPCPVCLGAKLGTWGPRVRPRRNVSQVSEVQGKDDVHVGAWAQFVLLFALTCRPMSVFGIHSDFFFR